MVKRFEAFTLGLSRVNSGLNKLASEELKSFGLKGNYAVYLVALSKNEEGLTSANLCEMCNKDKAEVSRAVSTMEKKGIVVRESVTKNAYRARIKLTKTGKEISDALRQRIILRVEQVGKGLTDEQRDHFYLALQVIADNFNKINQNELL